MSGRWASIAYFDDDGLCELVVSGPGRIDQPFAWSAPVLPGTKPRDVWFDRASGEPRASQPGNVKALLGLPDICPTTVIEATIPPDCVAVVDGVRFIKSLTIPAGKSRPLLIELRGALVGTHRLISQAEADEAEAGPAHLRLAELREEITNLTARIEALERKA